MVTHQKAIPVMKNSDDYQAKIKIVFLNFLTVAIIILLMKAMHVQCLVIMVRD